MNDDLSTNDLNGSTENNIASKTNENQTNGSHINGSYTNGSHTNGSHTNGSHTNGSHTNGSHANCSQTNGNHTNGNHTDKSYTNSSQTNGSYAPHSEPIAIIGMGCRLPSGASSPSKLWDLLINSRSAHSDMPTSRFNANGYQNPNSDFPGSIPSNGGYFIDEDIRSLENGFFGINNLEAIYMDPQQRKLLEVVYECFESAGAPLHTLSGANVGCYVANFTTDYVTMQSKDPEYFHRYSSTGMGATILANRISHVFNLLGPSLVLDTACSSSLYCLHIACAALAGDECDAAVVAGANLIQSPEMHLAAVKAGVISNTSTCHTFDVAADGYGRAEGVGALYLKRLSDAIRDNDPIRSIIRGTAINSNGKTNGISLPSATGQEAVIRKAYAKAGLAPDETIYIEAHGTGTPVGDPIEVEALSHVFHHKSGHPSLIGSIKTNLGHSEAVSGISSVIKVVLAFERGFIPPTIGVNNINPNLKLAERNVEIVTKPTAWPKDILQRASINSFGYGGANAHAILEPAGAHVPVGFKVPSERSRGLTRAEDTFLLPFSAHSKGSLVSRVADLAILDLDHIRLDDLAYTLASRRSRLSTRGFLLARKSHVNTDVAFVNLRTLDMSTDARPLPVAFIFTGQGAQWPQMGYQLMEQYSSFRKTVTDLDAYLARLPHKPSWTIYDTILEPAEMSTLYTAARSQTVCTAIQIALVALLREWGVTAEAVVGHSSGEIAAAFAAGHVTDFEAIIIAYYRGLLVSKSTSKGAMMVAGMDAISASKEIRKSEFNTRVRVACINSPESVTISGDCDAVDELLREFEGRGIFARKLKTDGKAYHSHQMKVIGQQYEELLSENLQKGDAKDRVPLRAQMISSVTGQPIHMNSKIHPNYWRTNLESPVLFDDALQTLMAGKKYHLIELGPHSALQLPIEQIRKKMQLPRTSLIYSSTIIRNTSSITSMLNLAGYLYLRGYDVDFTKINSTSSTTNKVLYNLPNYKWYYQSTLWNEPRGSQEFRSRKFPHHDLLGSRIHGTSGETVSWRNVLKVKDVPWLQDHKLGPLTVFPGAGYLTMAIEALCQMQDMDFRNYATVAFRQVHFVKALMLDEKAGVEIMTQLRRVQLSGVVASTIWWEFDISSFKENTSTVHATGRIGLDSAVLSTDRKMSHGTIMEQQATRTWYDKLAREGLNFGPAFQTLTEVHLDRERQLQVAMSKAKLPEASPQHSRYIVHPTTIDAMLQTGIIATSGGSSHNLHGKVPVSMAEAQITVAGFEDSALPATIHAVSETIGFGTSMINMELHDFKGQPVARISSLRIIAFEEDAMEKGTTEKRYPVLRVLWKPDICTMASGESTILADYADQFVSSMPGRFTDVDVGRMAGVLDLITHDRPTLRILELGIQDDKITEQFLDILDAQIPIKRFESYTQGSISKEGKLVGRRVRSALDLGEANKNDELDDGTLYDLIVLPSSTSTDSNLDTHIKTMLNYLEAAGRLLFATRPGARPPLDRDQFSTIFTGPADDVSRITLVQPSGNHLVEDAAKPYNVVLVERDSDSRFNELLQDKLSKLFGYNIPRIPLCQASSATLPPGSVIISTIELEKSLLDTITSDEMANVKSMTDHASVLLWISGGNLFKAEKPDFALVPGLSRSIMLEQPALMFCTFDINNVPRELDTAVDNVLAILHQALHSQSPEFEYLQNGNILYSSRLYPDETTNTKFRERQGSTPLQLSLQDAGHCQLSIKHVGQLDTIRFVQSSQKDTALQPGFVEVQDIHVLGGRIDTKDSTCSLEFTGIVKRTGSAVTQLTAGDKVAVMAPNHFGTYECVPEWACCKLNEDESLTTLSTIPLVFSTALYALQHRANIQRGESVLIHSGAGGVGLAAIQVAQLLGAKIFTTVSTEAKKQFLVDTFNLNPDHIFSSRESLFLPNILKQTSSRGVDVILNSLTGDLLHDSWQAIAEFGRFVEIGKRDILDSGKLSMELFARSASFTAFDLTSLYHSSNDVHQGMWSRLLKDSIQLFREGKINAISVKTFDISEITQAFRHFSLRTRVGKVAVSFENSASLVHVIPTKHSASFDPKKTYFLVGCLGGLGRSLAKWMLKQGARRFAFLGRSGLEKTPARKLVEDLQDHGAIVDVFRGDASSYEDVQKAISQVQTPIGGIVHAAMGLNETLFTTMSSKYWHTSIDPKIQGAWNLHNAVNGKDAALDFFLITSSISGTVGTATESNYCAANAFLDTFARYRRSLNLPATALGLGMISEVGYLHEHPEIEAILVRKGIHAINEDEMLQICDIALSPQPASADTAPGAEHFAPAHILTGLEILGLDKIRKRGFEGPRHMLYSDPRLAIVSGALSAISIANAAGPANSAVAGSSHLAGCVAGCRRAGADDGARLQLVDCVQGLVGQKLRDVFLLGAQPPAQTRMADLGMDSMMSAELRLFLFQTFKVDVPFLSLLASTTTLDGLVDTIVTALVGHVGGREGGE